MHLNTTKSSGSFECLLITKCKAFSALSYGMVEIFSSNNTVKPVLSGHSKRTPKLVFKTDYLLMQVKSIAECSKGSILQYFQPSLSYHLSLKSFFCLFLSGRLRQTLLYMCLMGISKVLWHRKRYSCKFIQVLSMTNPHLLDFFERS